MSPAPIAPANRASLPPSAPIQIGGSWANMVEGFFAKLTNKAIRRGAFGSVPELIAAIDAYLAQTNTNPTPFTWTKTADQIVKKVQRGRMTLEAITN